MSYVEPFDLWQRIELRDDVRAARAGRYNIAALVTAASDKRRASVARAAEHGLYETVKVALEAGVHPNDSAIFKDGGLLAMHHWYSRPEYAALALKHGANPDTGAYGSVDLSDKSMCVARYLATRLYEDARDEAESLSSMQAEALAVILRAGSTNADVNPVYEHVGHYSPSAAWLLASITKKRPEVDERIARVIPLLKAAGCDIDTPCGNGNGHAFAVPVVAAIRQGRLSVAKAFIDAGAKIDDAHIATGTRKTSPLTIFEEADKQFGAGGASLIREAIMAKVIAEVRQPAPAAPGDRPRRRAMGV